MMKFKFIFFITGLLFSFPGSASALTETGIASKQLILDEYTHPETAIELKPAFSGFSYKTAGVCFLGVGDCAAPLDYTIDTETQCKNEGFSKQNCSSVQAVDGVCPYNSAFGKGCKCSSNLISCPAGQVGEGESCNGKYLSCKCDPNLVSCASNQNGNGAYCGGRYQSCICKPEYQYNSSNCTYPRSVSGTSCGGKYTGCSCPSGVSAGTFGCAEFYPAPCSSVCKIANSDNCQNRTAVSTPYGCAEYWPDCSTKCKTAYNDNCRNRDDVPHPNGCQTYWPDCASKCQVAQTASCETDIKTALPDAVLVKTIGDVSSYGMSGKKVVLMNNISDPNVSLYIGNGTTLYPANFTGSSLCSKTTLTANTIQLTGSSFIEADITAKELIFSSASVTGNTKLSADKITISTGTNSLSNGSLTANGNLDVNANFNFAATTGKIYANNLTVAEGKTLTISGNNANITTEIYEKLEMKPTSNLNINNGTHNINVWHFTSGPSYSKNAVKITNAKIYLNKGKQASTTPYHNSVLDASYSTGKSQVEIVLSGSTLDFGSGELNYNEGTDDSKTLTFRLQNSSKITNLGGLVCWGGNGLRFFLAANSNSTVQMLGKTGTCSGDETVIRARDRSKDAYVYLDHESKGVMVFACMFYQSGSGYDYLCERSAACKNISGVTDTCEYSLKQQPDKYTTCQSCKRGYTTYYGGKCTVNCTSRYYDGQYQCDSECGYSSYGGCIESCMQDVQYEYDNCESSYQM